MKQPKSIKLDIQKQIMKKTTDGIINVLFRMYEASDKHCEFAEFCKELLNDTPEQFYARPIKAEHD